MSQRSHSHNHTHGHDHGHSHDHGHGHSHDHGHEQEHEQEDPVQAERAHFRKVLTAFAYYRRHALNHNHRKRHDFMALPEQHKKIIPDVLKKINKVDECIETNMVMLREIVRGANMFMDEDPIALMAEGYKVQGNKPPVSPMDMDKVRSTLKQFVRDWAKEGQGERDVTYGPVIEELESLFKDVSVENRGAIRVLVPGAGLGRLAFDIARKGFSCQGNEFSFYMLLASHFVLNRMSKTEEYEIYPFVHSFSNIKSSDDQLTPIRIPDVLPANLPPTVDFSMVAGDFLEVYGEQENNRGAWDVVVTCFFIDTAKNILENIQVIHRTLKEGGMWINIGPLLYHFEDTPGESSVELSLEEVKRVSREIGFEFKKESMVTTTYTSNPQGMLKYVYECAFWTAVKVDKPSK
ncbi:N2227-like protein-domain-containing protein [Radiomyces spectabilis]|uniref:N2227-like protein-domain-containing protein n=1 Tax=Radiomyces spectabilis TaxID=64574 RepID=UPI00221E50AD|nr:N2227-like protein-domain-containing protein [Radiomyces spectabilis]KAI8365391.1 N2227-like protein-domain-containing protein [Radiomyces spectabilis]